MKKMFLVLLCFPLLALAQKTAQGFTVSGQLTGVTDGTEIKLIRNGENEELGKTTVSKGNFLLKGSVKEPVLCFLVIGSQSPIEIYVENSKILVSPDKSHDGKYIITGSVSNKDFSDFTNTCVPLVQQMSNLASTINSMVAGPERDGLMKSYTETQQGIQNAIDKFVTDKPHSLVTPFVLSITSQFYDDVMLLEKRFDKLDAVVRNSDEGKKLATLIATNKIGAVGTQELDFSQPDTSGKLVALSSFHGKYVLVDFWASWCGPCRQENPNVVRSYEKFKDKNFTILSVSLDRPGQRDRWLQAIKEDGLTWNHVSDLQFWNNAAAQLYHINNIPQNMLIAPDGKIVGKNLRGAALEAKLCEILGCN